MPTKSWYKWKSVKNSIHSSMLTEHVRKGISQESITVLEFGYFHKNWSVLWNKDCVKDHLESTKQFINTSYHKYFSLCMVSEKLWLNENSLFLK